MQTVVTGLDRPSDLALDLSSGKVLWNDFNPGITQRADLDGGNLETLFAPGGPPCRDGLGAILRADLNGSNVETIVSG